MPDTLTLIIDGTAHRLVLVKPEQYEKLLKADRRRRRAEHKVRKLQKASKHEPITFQEIKDAAIANALIFCKGNRELAAGMLDIPERTFYRHVKRLKMKGLIE